MLSIFIKDNLMEVLQSVRPDLQLRAGIFQFSDLSQSIIPEHWHDDFEFVRALDKPILYTINGQEILLSAGDAIFVNSSRIHSLRPAKYADGQCQVLVIGNSVLTSNVMIASELMTRLIAGSDYIILSAKEEKGRSKIGRIEQILSLVNEAGPEAALAIIGHFSILIADLCRENKQSSLLSNADLQSIKQMVAFTIQQYMQPLRVADIARAGNVSVTKCGRLFHQVLHQTPMRYLQQIRLRKAAAHLRKDQLTIAEIAAACGFSDAAYFIRTFRESNGITPLHYRQKFLKSTHHADEKDSR